MNARIVSHIATVVVAGIVGALGAGCSVATESTEGAATREGTVRTERCVGTCPPIYIPPQPTIANTTGPVCTQTPYGVTPDSCGASVAVPAALNGLGCTVGMKINLGNVWMCPAGAHVPSVISGVSGEQVIIDTAPFCSDCIGSPDTGWEIVVDTWPNGGGHIGGGCSGPCAFSGKGI